MWRLTWQPTWRLSLAAKFKFGLGFLILNVIANLTINFIIFAPRAEAGFLIQGGPTWRFFSFSPQAEEDTPNYEGYGLELATGYSVDRVIDVTVLAQYTPGSLGVAKITDEDASLVVLGGMIGATILRQGYAGIYGGTGYYNGVSHSGHDGIVKGNFNGPAMGITVGANLGQPKGSDEVMVRLQVYTERAWMSGRQTAESEIEKRTISSFGVGFLWVFNSLGGGAWESRVMKSFLD